MKPKMRHLFFKWLDVNYSRFAVPINATKRSKRRVDIVFTGINPVISARVSEWGEYISLEVIASKQNFLDFLEDFDCGAIKKDGGYICPICEAEKQRRFPDLKSLLEDHLFEPFLKWVNGELAAAQWIGIWEQEGCCDARLIKTLPDSRDAEYKLLRHDKRRRYLSGSNMAVRL